VKDRVLVFGYYGMGNSGSEIRLKIMIEDIRKANSDADITVAIFRYNRIKRIKGIHYIFLNNIFTGVLEMIEKIPQFDYIVCGEGIPFVDFCGTGFLNYFLPILYFGHLFGKKTACYSFDIDELTNFHEWITLKILKNVDLLVARTRTTYNFLKKRGINKNLHLGTDTSLLFNVKKLENKRKKIGFCLKDLYCYPVKMRLFGRKENRYHYPYYYTYAHHGKEKYKEFVKKMSSMIDTLLEEDKSLWIQLIILEHQMDYKVARDIYKAVKNKQRVELISRKNHELEYIKSVFSNLKCLIATRYHALLQGLEYKTPTLVLSSDERFEYFIEEMGLGKFLIKVYEEGLNTKKIINFIKKYSFVKEEFNSKVRKKFPVLKKRAKHNYKFLVKFFKS